MRGKGGGEEIVLKMVSLISIIMVMSNCVEQMISVFVDINDIIILIEG